MAGLRNSTTTHTFTKQQKHMQFIKPTQVCWFFLALFIIETFQF